MAEPTGKEYVLKSYQDFMNLSVEQFERMAPDFVSWKKAHEEISAQANLVASALGLPPEDIFQLPDHFVWIDDGITGEGVVDVSIQTPDGQTLGHTQLNVGKSDV